MKILNLDDADIPVRRMRHNPLSGGLEESKKSELFLKGPVPLSWLSKASLLPGKSFNVGLALWWLEGMAKGKPHKLTGSVIGHFGVKRDASRDALRRMEQAGLVRVERNPGSCPLVSILK